jgi:hypothetical protein
MTGVAGPELISELERVCEPFLFRLAPEWYSRVPRLVRQFVDAVWSRRDGWGDVLYHRATGAFILVFRRHPENYYILYPDPKYKRVGVSYQMSLQAQYDPKLRTPDGWVRRYAFDNLWWYEQCDSPERPPHEGNAWQVVPGRRFTRKPMSAVIKS